MKRLGVWMWPYSIREKGAKETVKYCKRARVTDIYFLAKGLDGTTAFHGPYAPFDCERDLLQELLCEAHACGIRVHAWFTSACDEHYKQLHPESGRCHLYRGRDRELISLADEGYLAHMEKIVRDVCRRYDVDGLHLDYIRYNHMLYGWGDEDMARYEAAGADGKRLKGLMDEAYQGDVRKEDMLIDLARKGDKDLLAFARVRRADVWRFAKTLCDAAKQEKPVIELSAALMPEGAYPDHTFADLHYGQSYEDAARLYDYALPMAYSKAYENKDGAWVRDVANWTLGYGIKTVVGLHAYEDGTGETLCADIRALEHTLADGICLFREGACVWAFAGDTYVTVYNNLKETLTRLILKQDGGDAEMQISLAAGEEKTFRAEKAVYCVRAFGENGEVSVHLTQE